MTFSRIFVQLNSLNVKIKVTGQRKIHLESVCCPLFAEWLVINEFNVSKIIEQTTLAAVIGVLFDAKMLLEPVSLNIFGVACINCGVNSNEIDKGWQSDQIHRKLLLLLKPISWTVWLFGQNGNNPFINRNKMGNRKLGLFLLKFKKKHSRTLHFNSFGNRGLFCTPH